MLFDAEIDVTNIINPLRRMNNGLVMRQAQGI